MKNMESFVAGIVTTIRLFLLNTMEMAKEAGKSLRHLRLSTAANGREELFLKMVKSDLVMFLVVLLWELSLVVRGIIILSVPFLFIFFYLPFTIIETIFATIAICAYQKEKDQRDPDLDFNFNYRRSNEGLFPFDEPKPYTRVLVKYNSMDKASMELEEEV